MNRVCLRVAAFAFAAWALPAAAIELGDPAPEFKVAEWVKGKPITLAEGKEKHVFVVEFWATWCGPCRTTIPHLTELEKKYKDKGLVVIGVTDETKETVSGFVEKMGDKMDYRVAIETGGKGRRSVGDMSKALMQPFGVEGIPHAFVVDRKGRLVWHGHPMDGLDGVIEAVLAGKFDLEAVKAESAADKLLSEYYQAASDGKARAAAKIGKEFLEKAAKSKDRLSQLAFMIAKDRRLKNPDYGLALSAAEAAYKLDAKDARVVAVYALAQHHNGKNDDAIKTMSAAIELCDAEQANLKESLKQELERFKGGDADDAEAEGDEAKDDAEDADDSKDNG